MSDSEQGGVGQREVAYRLFAAEFEDSDLSYSESDEERAPNYVITPTGAQVNRLFVVGVLTEVEQVGEDILRGRVVDPTGAFVIYAGQYQPDEQAFLERVDTPTFVAVTGKARTFQPDDSEQVYTSIRPESINEVSAETRDRWTVQATVQTLDRIGHAAAALTVDGSDDAVREALGKRGVDERQAASILLALDHYGTTPTYLQALRELALDGARVVAGERDEVAELTTVPSESGDVAASSLTGTAVDEIPEPDTPAVSQSAAEELPETETEDTSESPTEAVTHTDDSTETEPAIEDEPDDGTGDDLGDFDPEEFELGEETREEIEAEFGTEFQTGGEVDEPGEADIETPTGETEPTPPEESTESDDEPADEPDQDDDEPADEPEDLQAAVVELMSELDEGTGADRQALLDAMAERYGVDESETESAIQDALMAGECYEPDDTTLKPI